MKDYDLIIAVLIEEIMRADRMLEASKAAAALAKIQKWRKDAEAEDKHLFGSVADPVGMTDSGMMAVRGRP